MGGTTLGDLDTMPSKRKKRRETEERRTAAGNLTCDDGAARRLVRAATYQKAGRLEDAIKEYRTVIGEVPDSIEEYVNLGNALIPRGALNEALPIFDQALSLHPNLVSARNGKGVALKKLGRLTEAAREFEAALLMEPGAAYLHNNLGNVLQEQSKSSEALGCYRRATDLDPDYAEAHFSLGKLLKDEGRPIEAIASFERALAANPEYADAHFSLAMAYLVVGDFARGWREYEWRWRCTHFPGRRIDGQAWDGSDPNGRRLLLHAEQGFGDTLQAARYARLVKERGAHVIFYCQRELARVIETVPGVDDVAVEGAGVPAFDMYAAAMSLPAIFGTTLETIPREVPYLQAPVDYDGRFDALLRAAAGKRKIGIVWAGRPNHPNAPRRDCPSTSLAPLSRLPDVALFSLQTGGASDGLYALENVVDLAPLLEDFGHTAALIDRLDLVITVDTAVAHLAGAMGRPVWLLLPFVAEWRWLLEREDSPWYPSMRLFRQDRPGDWAGVMRRVVKALTEEEGRESAMGREKGGERAPF